MPPLAIFVQPIGIWGISYDLYTNPIEESPPDGWGIRRSANSSFFCRSICPELIVIIGRIYERLVKYLVSNGFHPSQYSSYNIDNATPFMVWQIMLSLRQLKPLGVFPSVVKGCNMFRIPVEQFIVDDDVRLGGVFSPNLLAMTPRALATSLGVPGVPLPANYPNPMPDVMLPVNVAANNASRNPANWCE